MTKSIIRQGIPRYAGGRSEELITDVQKTRNHGYDVIVGGELFTVTPVTLANLSLNQNSNQQAPDATNFFPVGGMPTAATA